MAVGKLCYVRIGVKYKMIKGTAETMTSMICITILMSIALFKGMNGLLLTLAVGALCGLGGYEVNHVCNMMRRGEK